MHDPLELTITAPQRLVVSKKTGKARWVPEWLTQNSVRRAPWYEKAPLIRQWRSLAALTAHARRLEPFTQPVIITATPHRAGRRVDVDAIAPTVKACVDGLVDARLLADDTPDHVVRVIYDPPVKPAEHDLLHLRIEEAP